MDSSAEEFETKFETKFEKELAKGIGEFNAGQFFECHETLEALWMTFEGSERDLIQGLIQISVGYLHLSRGNPVGASKLFKKGLGRIEKYPPRTCSIRVDELSQAVQKSINILNSESNVQNIGHKVDTGSNNYPVIRFDRA